MPGIAGCQGNEGHTGTAWEVLALVEDPDTQR